MKILIKWEKCVTCKENVLSMLTDPTYLDYSKYFNSIIHSDCYSEAY